MYQKIDNLQCVRALAAISVLVNHFFNYGLDHYFAISSSINIVKYLNMLGTLGVYSFFILSGFLMIYTLKSNKSPYQFLLDRVARIYPPYWIISIPIIIWAILYPHYGHSIKNFTQFVQNLTLLPSFAKYNYNCANYPAWTLIYEMFFYILFTFIISITKKIHKVVLLLTIILFGIFFIGRTFIIHPQNYSYFNIAYIIQFPAIFCFLIGAWIALILKKTNFHINFSGNTFIIIAIGIFTIAPIFISTLKNDLITFCLLGFTSTIIIILSIISQNSSFSRLKNIGNSSYSIYLSHSAAIILRNVLFYSTHILYKNISLFIVLNIVAIMIVIQFSNYIYKFIEYPSVIYFKKLIKPQNLKTHANTNK